MRFFYLTDSYDEMCPDSKTSKTHATQIALLARNSSLGVLGNCNTVAVISIRNEGGKYQVTNSREIS